MILGLGLHEFSSAGLRFHSGHRYQYSPLAQAVLNYLEVAVSFRVREICHKIHRDLLKEMVGNREGP